MTIDAFEQAYATVGFSPCTDEKPEEGFEKIAIYTLNGVPTHAARLLDTGEWTSKLGYEADISHPLHGLDRNDGPQPYGAPAVFMRRPV